MESAEENLDWIVIWGCNRKFQYERDWILQLLKPGWIKEVDWSQKLESIPIYENTKVILIESGIHSLRKKLTDQEENNIIISRLRRLDALTGKKEFKLLHLSDEEGKDGDSLYSEVNTRVKIIRNFYQSRFESLNNLETLPLGPTRCSLAPNKWLKASDRKFIWNFIGTAWENTERRIAVKSFKERLPQRNYIYFTEKFGRGLNEVGYTNIVSNSIFTLCPQGARHFDTFRLYEALELGSIPIYIAKNDPHKDIFKTERPPLPYFEDWEQASFFVKSIIEIPKILEALQINTYFWWLNEKGRLSEKIKE